MKTTKRHTFKEYPFLLKLRKDGWIVNKYNKHILICAYEYGRFYAKLKEQGK